MDNFPPPVSSAQQAATCKLDISARWGGEEEGGPGRRADASMKTLSSAGASVEPGQARVLSAAEPRGHQTKLSRAQLVVMMA